MAKKVRHRELCGMVGVKYPIIQAGMGPFGTNRLAAVAANAGVLGIISTSGFGMLGRPPARLTAKEAQVARTLGDSKGGSRQEQMKQALYRVKEQTRETKGIFGINSC
jgi:NAD(P)H-dependent flavin oxidoreductase YrpB (nitropropane dioxygenase family)